MKIGGCVKLPDGRIGRVQERLAKGYKVRVQRETSRTHEFVVVAAKKLKPVHCPKGWMSPDGYNRYLKITLAKMRKRQAATGRRARGQ
ncbi:MAG: hypothetical protein ACREIM_09275 [Nitrospiraceae bacterium]